MQLSCVKMFIFTKEGKPKPLNSRPNYKMFYNGKQQKDEA